jgi:hypothetical protein
MITIDEGLVYQLKHHAGLSALISTRVYPDNIPQRVTLPAISYQRIGSPNRTETMDQTATSLAHPRFQLTVWAENVASRSAVKAQVIAALEGFRGTFGTGANTVTVNSSFCENEIDHYDPESGLRYSFMDFVIGHQE